MNYYAVAPLAVAQQDTYTYAVNTKLDPGLVVTIPFAGRRCLGIVWQAAAPHPKAKPVSNVTGVRLTATQRDIAEWIASEYLAPLGPVLKMMVNSYVVRYKPEKVVGSTVKRSVVRPFQAHLDMAPRRLASYLTALHQARRRHQNTALIVPDIALTPTWLARLNSEIPGLVVYHSRLTPKQRANIWWQVQSGQTINVVGARSTLLLPWQSLALLIIDEEDDPSFKQDQTPRYQTSRLAAALAKRLGTKLIYGSVAPSLETYQFIQQTVKLPDERVPPLAKLRVVDPSRARPRRDELIGYELWMALRKTLQHQQTATLYAPNRYHQDLVGELRRQFPKTPLIQFSPDSRTSTTTDEQLASFRSGDAPILISGHQLAQDWSIAPGLLGIIGIDRWLELPSYQATEKTYGFLRKLYRLLPETATMFIQTGSPDHPVFTYLRQPFAAFTEAELAERRTLKLPPWQRLTTLTFQSAHTIPAAAIAREQANKFKEHGIETAAVESSAPRADQRTPSWQVSVRGNPARLKGLILPGARVDVTP